MAKHSWACPECETEVRYKGLCRDCTEYDSAGNPIKPVQRVKKNDYQKYHHSRRATKQDFTNSRRPKPSKKQLEGLMESMNAGSKIAEPHVHTDDCDHSHDEENFTPIGKDITDAINEIKDMGFAVVNDIGDEEE